MATSTNSQPQRAVIIEDSIPQRENLINLLTRYCPQIEVVGFADNPLDGFQIIQAEEPSLLFLDIQLTDGTGFDLLEQLYHAGPIDFEVIFVTAYGMYEYALQAIRYAALEFLEKPVAATDLVEAVSKLGQRHQHQRQQNDKIVQLLHNITQTETQSVNRVAFHLPRGIMEFVHTDDILYLSANTTITEIHLRDGRKINAMKHLGYYAEILLRNDDFFRISSKLVVNMQYVRRYDNNSQTIYLKDGSYLYASRRLGTEFKRYWANQPAYCEGQIAATEKIGLLKRLFG